MNENGHFSPISPGLFTSIVCWSGFIELHGCLDLVCGLIDLCRAGWMEAMCPMEPNRGGGGAGYWKSKGRLDLLCH